VVNYTNAKGEKTTVVTITAQNVTVREESMAPLASDILPAAAPSGGAPITAAAAAASDVALREALVGSRIILPVYNPGMFAEIKTEANKGTRIDLIINPASGPGKVKNALYYNFIQEVGNLPNIRLLYYVDIQTKDDQVKLPGPGLLQNGQTKSEQQVQAEILQYVNLYGLPHGYFFDDITWGDGPPGTGAPTAIKLGYIQTFARLKFAVSAVVSRVENPIYRRQFRDWLHNGRVGPRPQLFITRRYTRGYPVLIANAGAPGDDERREILGNMEPGKPFSLISGAIMYETSYPTKDDHGLYNPYDYAFSGTPVGIPNGEPSSVPPGSVPATFKAELRSKASKVGVMVLGGGTGGQPNLKDSLCAAVDTVDGYGKPQWFFWSHRIDNTDPLNGEVYEHLPDDGSGNSFGTMCSFFRPASVPV
jgi:hypothetical protein